MRQKNETATSFNKLKEITQAIQAQKNSTQASDNANTSELTPKGALKPKGSAHAKKGALKPTKRAFSERQKTTIRDNSHASAKESQRVALMHKHTIYLRGNALYLNYTKNSKRYRVSLNRLTKSLNLNNTQALEYLDGLGLGQILKMLKEASKPNEEPKQGSQRAHKKTKNATIAQAKESFFNQKIGLKKESLRFMHLRFSTILKLMNIKESYKVPKITKESVTNYYNNALKKYKKNTLISLNALLKSFLEFCESERFLEKNPYFAITLKNAQEGYKQKLKSYNNL